MEDVRGPQKGVFAAWLQVDIYRDAAPKELLKPPFRMLWALNALGRRWPPSASPFVKRPLESVRCSTYAPGGATGAGEVHQAGGSKGETGAEKREIGQDVLF